MFDTHAIARALAGANLTPAQVDAITDAVRQAAEQESVDVDALATKSDIAALEARIYRAMLVQAGAIVGALVGIAGIVVGALRLLG
jgi:hypothetical protein